MTIHQKQSYETKQKLSASLKKLMKTNDFHKISINVLVRDAHLNRNSFYYHFNNIFDLLKYTLENDAVRIVKQINPRQNMETTVYFIMDYIDQNKAFCTCAYKSLGKTELKKFLQNNFQDIITDIIDEVIEKNNFEVSEDFKKYVIYSHTESTATHIIGYLKNDFHLSKKQTAHYILLLFHSSVTTSLRIAHNNKL